MSNVRTYTVKAAWFDDAMVTLRVDLDKLTPELATDINAFWSDADDRLECEDRDVVRTVVRMFGAAAIDFFMKDGGASFGAASDISRWATEKVLKDLYEGWPDFDHLGIVIVAAEVSSVGYDDVSLVAEP